MSIAEVQDNLWLESLPKILDIYFENMDAETAADMDIVFDERSHSGAIAFLSHSR